MNINLSDFIKETVIKRKESFFIKDINDYNAELSSQIKGKSLLVIGGAGTIGSSFIKAALKFHPSKLVVVDTNENGLTELVRDLRSTSDQYIPNEFLTYPISLGSTVFEKAFKFHGPFQIVANFAAHKHVRSEKDVFSIEALLDNNIIKAKQLLDLLVVQRPEHFFCVSTDKAANPVNIMGASKSLMENLIFAYSDLFKTSTARFANVAFSNGSLLEGFINRVAKKQPISCPSDVRRFFVSPEESGQICLIACVLGKSREVFFPKFDMENDLINFADLFTPFLNACGYEPIIFYSEEEARSHIDRIEQGQYPVYSFISDTSGEKLYEEFFTDSELPNLTNFNSLGFLSKKNEYSLTEINNIIDELLKMFSRSLEKKQIVTWLKQYVHDFDHIETGLSLDKKM